MSRDLCKSTEWSKVTTKLQPSVLHWARATMHNYSSAVICTVRDKMKLTAAFHQISAMGDRHLGESFHSKKERKFSDKPSYKCCIKKKPKAVVSQWICNDTSCHFVIVKAALPGGLQMIKLTQVSLSTSQKFWWASCTVSEAEPTSPTVTV